MNTPELVAIGHVTWDLRPDNLAKREGGGAVAFAAVTAERLRVKAAIVTSCTDDYPKSQVASSSDAFVQVPSQETSTFENRYDANGDRQQILHARASDISRRDIPDSWRSPKLLFVGPLTQELPKDCLDWFNPEFSCVVPQGWLRSWHTPLPSPVRVETRPPKGMSIGWDICVVSESEVSADAVSDWQAVANVLVVTKGDRGADLYHRGTPIPIVVSSFADSVECAGKDTTGAGDVFAAAMLIRYSETRDAAASAQFASICAALSTRALSWDAVENPGCLGRNA